MEGAGVRVTVAAMVAVLLVCLCGQESHAAHLPSFPGPSPAPSPANSSAVPPPAPSPTTSSMDGTTQGSLQPQECGDRCAYRCSNTAYRKPCMFFCQKCCSTCLCVPPGTYGNKETCPCYNNWKTKRGGPKCP